MTDKPTILAIKGDARQDSAIAALGKYYDITESSFPLSGAGAADILLLPMLTRSGSFEGIETRLKRGALVLGGRIPEDTKNCLESAGYKVYDYYERESLRIKNALPTAEGVLMLAMENTRRTISGSCVLITGFGACARQTARLFHALGARVLVAARNKAQLSEAEALGYKTGTLLHIPNIIGSADIIINTVPAHIIGRSEIAASKRDALFIEIASFPYGIDGQAAQNLGRAYINAPGLPGKYAPLTSGEYIAQTVSDIISERRDSYE